MSSTSTIQRVAVRNLQANHNLQLDLSKYEKLDLLQAGHLRHFHNLVSALDGEWPHMGGLETQQEFLDAFRYQLAQMAYAVGLTHYHRLPAAKSMLKPLLRRIIRKMLHVQVWGYWYLQSQSGIQVDPGLEKLREPWADPVVKENIMYSGHLLLMTSLYAMLFDDDEFEKPESICFDWSPTFWGLGPKYFKYDNRSIQNIILSEMERNGWVGVCCEPNVVFLVCNQFALIGMRYNDIRDGTNMLGPVLEKYKSAIRERGLLQDDALYHDWLFLRQNIAVPAKSVGFMAWGNAFMNSWNSDYVHANFEKQALGFITAIDNQVRLQPAETGLEYRQIALAENKDSKDADVLDRAKRAVAAKPLKPTHLNAPLFGYVVQWLSEVGRETELNGLLDYADKNLKPTWERGGLYYPRNDSLTDQDGNWTHMEPYSGNAAIGYARLNVKNGQKMMYDSPWTRQLLATRPWIDGVELSQGLDCLRSVWDAENNALVLTLRTWDGATVVARPTAMNLAKGVWSVYVQGELANTVNLERPGSLAVEATVDGDEVDIVFIQETE